MLVTHTLLLTAAALAAPACTDSKKPAPAASAAAPAALSPANAEIAQFWAWFRDHAAELHANPQLEQVMHTLGDELAKVNKGVFAELAGGDTRTLVLTANGDKALFPLVQQLYDARVAAPGWKVVAFRQRGLGGTSIRLEGKQIDFAQMKFVAQPNGSSMDVTIYVPKLGSEEERMRAGFLALDHLVGEYDVETRVAGVSVETLDKAPHDAKPLPQLPAQIDALK